MKRFAVRASVLILVILSLGFFYVVAETRPPSGPGSPIGLTIPRGEPAFSIGNRLEQVGLIRNARVFSWIVRIRGSERELKAGQYELPRNLDAFEVVDYLLEGRTRTTRVVVPEGLTIREAAPLIASHDFAGSPSHGRSIKFHIARLEAQYSLFT